MRITRAAPSLALIALALTLSGCVSGPSNPASSPSVSGDVDLKPQPAQARETGLTRPAQVFEGDCSNLFDAEDLAAIMGAASVELVTERRAVDADNLVEQQGGLRCVWRASGGSGSISVVALPSAAVDYAASNDCRMWGDLIGLACPLEADVNGILLSGDVFVTADDPTAPTAAQSALLDLFATNSTEGNVVPVPIPAAGAWARPVDCEKAVKTADLSLISGLGVGSTGDRPIGSDATYYTQAEAALSGAYGLPSCLIVGESVMTTFVAAGGSRWMESAIAAAEGASELAVDGIDRVIVVPPGPDSATIRINVFDGPNWLWFEVNFAKNAAPVAQALVASLDATAVD